MLNKRVKRVFVSLGMSLAIMSLASGCSMLKKVPETESETESETQPQTESESETEPETQLQTDIAYTSQDKSVRITLPDSTWKVTQDADEMRVFSSGSAAMINIVHAANENQMKTISVSESKEALTESLTKQYPSANAFEVVEFETSQSGALRTYEYVVKYNSTSMWAYSITYGILTDDEAYVIQGTVTDDNKVLLAAVQKAVESFTVLQNTKFSAVQNGKITQTQSETAQSETTQSENAKPADQELQSLKDYGTSATLYARDSVNIRNTPSTESNDNIIGSLENGDEVTVVGETSQWFKVNIKGNIGYISKAFLVNTKPTASTSAPATDADQENGSGSATASDATMIDAEKNSQIDYGSSTTLYTTTVVNVRTQPGTSGDMMDVFESGQQLQVIGETDNWYVVSVNGTTGYVSKSYVSSEPVSNSGNGTSNETPGDGSGTGDDGQNGSSTGGNGQNGSGSSDGDAQGGDSNTNVGTVSGTVTGTSMDGIVILGDDGNTYTINTSDANISTADGLYEGLYVSADIDYSASTSGSLYATNVSGH